MHRKFCNNRTKANKDKYKAYRDKLKVLLRQAEKKYYSNKFGAVSGNIRETWKLLGTILNSKRGDEIVNCFNSNGRDICNKQEIVDSFNDYFVNIGNRLAAAIPNATKHFSD